MQKSFADSAFRAEKRVSIYAKQFSTGMLISISAKSSCSLDDLHQ
jgi:hypothetical protein